jgi:hypothetical protein
MISPTIHIFLQPVIGRGYLVSRVRRHPSRTERQVPICRPIGHRLIRVQLLNWLTSIVLQRRLDWLTPSALWRWLDRLSLQWRLSACWLSRTGFSDLCRRCMRGYSTKHLLHVVWTNSWLSIAGAGCSLTGVGADEEQVRKVVAGEASRCGENK